MMQVCKKFIACKPGAGRDGIPAELVLLVSLMMCSQMISTGVLARTLSLTGDSKEAAHGDLVALSTIQHLADVENVKDEAQLKIETALPEVLQSVLDILLRTETGRKLADVFYSGATKGTKVMRRAILLTDPLYLQQLLNSFMANMWCPTASLSYLVDLLTGIIDDLESISGGTLQDVTISGFTVLRPMVQSAVTDLQQPNSSLAAAMGLSNAGRLALVPKMQSAVALVDQFIQALGAIQTNCSTTGRHRRSLLALSGFGDLANVESVEAHAQRTEKKVQSLGNILRPTVDASMPAGSRAAAGTRATLSQHRSLQELPFGLSISTLFCPSGLGDMLTYIKAFLPVIGLVPPGLVTLKDVILQFIALFSDILQLAFDSAQQQGGPIQIILQLSDADRIAMAANLDGVLQMLDVFKISTTAHGPFCPGAEPPRPPRVPRPPPPPPPRPPSPPKPPSPPPPKPPSPSPPPPWPSPPPPPPPPLTAASPPPLPSPPLSQPPPSPLPPLPSPPPPPPPLPPPPSPPPPPPPSPPPPSPPPPLPPSPPPPSPPPPPPPSPPPPSPPPPPPPSPPPPSPPPPPPPNPPPPPSPPPPPPSPPPPPPRPPPPTPSPPPPRPPPPPPSPAPPPPGPPPPRPPPSPPQPPSTSTQAPLPLTSPPSTSSQPTNSALVNEIPFPNTCSLGRNMSNSPVRVSRPTGPFNVTGVDATYCFKVTANSSLIDATAECADMNSARLFTIIVGVDCVSSRKIITAASANNQPVPIELSTLDWNGKTYGVLTVKRISKMFPTLPSGGLDVCLTLSSIRLNGACSTPMKLCGGGPSCVIQVTSDDFGCCPAGEVPL